MELDRELQSHNNLTEVADELMDINYESMIDFEDMTHTSFFDSNANFRSPITNESPNETPNPTKTSQNQMLDSNWSTQMFRNSLENLKSGNNLNSLLLIQKLINDQYNATNPLHLTNLGSPSNSSHQSGKSDSENASTDETIIRRRDRSSAILIEESQESLDATIKDKD